MWAGVRPPDRVYPRSRGGTANKKARLIPFVGLSPLARGNLVHLDGSGVLGGSIPARAGEPVKRHVRQARIRVYPRSRGGTLSAAHRTKRGRGLSPLARGNHPHQDRLRLRRGSIPARAGEPGVSGWSRMPTPVYPRSRGGTSAKGDLTMVYSGLSPLARGNPSRCALRRCAVGSIPARAGEPPSPRTCRRLGWVYPRSRGGTKETFDGRLYRLGLSPLARGNQFEGRHVAGGNGSIPARAGEPAA